MASKKTQTAIVKLEFSVAVIQPLCTDVSSEQQGVVSHTTSCLPSNTSNSLTKAALSFVPPSLPVGYVNAIAKLCGVKESIDLESYSLLTFCLEELRSQSVPEPTVQNNFFMSFIKSSKSMIDKYAPKHGFYFICKRLFLPTNALFIKT